MVITGSRYVVSRQGRVQKAVMTLQERGKYFFVLRALKTSKRMSTRPRMVVWTR